MIEAAKAPSSQVPPPQTFGRYVLHAPIARGGMATVHIARLVGAEGFSRLVAAKRPHPHFTEDPEFLTMFHDEARIASRIHHPNVVPVLDVVLEGNEVIIVQEYVHGVPLDRLFKAALVSEDTQIPIGIVTTVMSSVLAGLHAAHETRDELDQPLSIVHRDVSPENVMVSVDGVSRLLDFGIAKATTSAHVTRAGFFKGKIAYMAPEQLRGEDVTRAADIYATGVLLWELLAHRRLHAGRGEAELFNAVLTGAIPTLTAALESQRAWISNERWQMIQRLEPIVSRALATKSQARFGTADEMLRALVAAAPSASSTEVAQWVRSTGAEYLERRQSLLTSSEESWRSHSKIALAVSSTANGPISSSAPLESQMKLVSRREGTDEREVLGTPLLPIAITAPPLSEGDQKRARRAALIPWIAAASLLWLVGILLGVIVVRRGDAEPNAEQRAAAAAAAAAAVPPTLELPATPPPSTPSTPSMGVIPPSAPSDTVLNPQKPARATVAQMPAARYSPPAKAAPAPAPPPKAPAPPAHAAASAPSPAAPVAASAPSSKPDCDPPFYFEGSKKIYKSNCL